MINCYAVLIRASASEAARFRQFTGTRVAFALAIPQRARRRRSMVGHLSGVWCGSLGWADEVMYECMRASLPWLSCWNSSPGHTLRPLMRLPGVTIPALAIAVFDYRWSDRRVRMLGFLAGVRLTRSAHTRHHG
jgi:hypothetical protein